MRYKYKTRGIVLSRSPVGESSLYVTLLTPDLGLVRGLAQGLRESGAKLATALTTFTESDVVLVRGKDGWRITGAILGEHWSEHFGHVETRARAARVSNLLLRLVVGESHDHLLFSIMHTFFEAIAFKALAFKIPAFKAPAILSDEVGESAEILVVLRILSALGLDAGEIPEDLAEITNNRLAYIARINNGITASGL